MTSARAEIEVILQAQDRPDKVKTLVDRLKSINFGGNVLFWCKDLSCNVVMERVEHLVGIEARFLDWEEANKEKQDGYPTGTIKIVRHFFSDK